MLGFKTPYPQIQKLDTLNILSLRKWRKSQKQKVHSDLPFSHEAVHKIGHKITGRAPSSYAEASGFSQQRFIRLSCLPVTSLQEAPGKPFSPNLWVFVSETFYAT